MDKIYKAVIDDFLFPDWWLEDVALPVTPLTRHLCSSKQVDRMERWRIIASLVLLLRVGLKGVSHE